MLEKVINLATARLLTLSDILPAMSPGAWLFAFAGISAVGSIAQVIQLVLQVRTTNPAETGNFVAQSEGLALRVSARRLWAILLTALVSLCLSVIGFYASMTRGQTITVDNIESRIRAYLDTFRLGQAKLTEDPNRTFGLVVTTAGGRPISVFQPKSPNHYLVFHASVVVSDSDQRTLALLPMTQQELIVRDLRAVMALSKSGYSNIGLPLKNMLVEKMIPITDQLTEAAFIGALDEVESGQVLLLELFSKDLAQAQQQSAHQKPSPEKTVK
jgi:hypothetical protein